MQAPYVTPPPQPGSQPWISLGTGIAGLLTFPLVIALVISEPSAEYPEPWHTITHYSGAILPLGFVLSVVVVVFGIVSLQRRRAPEWAAIVGIVTGAIAAVLTISPTIGVIVTLVTGRL